ncbi:MAG: hypothetical protein MSS28_01705 [Tenericutes bacterium]|nr:hypothetical protein [Mycoplasmatota bacterium]
MSILNTAEFSIFGIELSKKEADSKKIKLKQESYANVQKKYDDFCLAQNHSEKIMPPIPETQPTNQEETIIIHIKNKNYAKIECKHEKLKDLISILKIEGSLLPQLAGKRALKIKEYMKNNILLNNGLESSKPIEAEEVIFQEKSSKDSVTEKVPEETVEKSLVGPPIINTTENIEKPSAVDTDKVKVSKNKTSTAKINKYIEDDTKEQHQDSIKPISDILKEIRIPKDKFKISSEPINIDDIVSKNVPDKENSAKKSTQSSKMEVGKLKDSLAKANQLKEELEEAKRNAEKAREQAEMAREKAEAEQHETEEVKRQLVETIKKLEEHNKKLEAEKKRNEEEAKKYAEESKEYIEKEKEYSSIQEEYKQTINEMLAIIG